MIGDHTSSCARCPVPFYINTGCSRRNFINELVTEDDFWLLSIELEEFIDELNYVLKSYMKYEYIVTQKMPEEFEMLEALINLNDKVINYIFDNYKD